MHKGKLILVGASLLACVGSALAVEPIMVAPRSSTDTIEIAGERIRFNGIDAPESWQVCEDAAGNPYRCGQHAATALEKFLAASRPTRCEYVERDRYRRFVGNCYRRDGESVNRWLVIEGHPVDWKRYSQVKAPAPHLLALWPLTSTTSAISHGARGY